jgi:hypothetical protein
MRRRLIEALTYPRILILQDIPPGDCLQNGRFESSGEQCRDCDLGQECHWLSCLNNFDDLANKPIHTLHASLLYSINLIRMRNEQTLRHSEGCSCESCDWVGDAEELSLEFSTKFTWAFSKDCGTEAIL